MNTQEIGQFLGLVAFHDNRKVGPGDIMAWEDVLPAEISLEDARTALRAHRRAGSEWLMPSHIITSVMAIRRERLTRAGTPPMPGDLSWQQEKEWRQLWCAKVKDGVTPEQAAAETSIAMRIHELPAVENATRVRAIEAFAGRKRDPKPEPPPKPKRFRWGPWVLARFDDDGNAIYCTEGHKLMHHLDPWGIELADFATPEAYDRWAEHVAGKGWGTPEVINWLNLAFTELNPDLPECQAAS